VKFSARRIICRWCIPYVVFQTVYIIFAVKVLKSGEQLQYTTPYWLLWYMLACIYYQVLLPMYDTMDKRRQALTLLCVFAVSLFVGYDKSFGYFMSLSRFFVFQPWFVLGYYCKKNDVFGRLSKHKVITYVSVGAAVAVILLSVPFLSEGSLKKQLLYGSYAYESCRGSAELRLMISLISLSWIVFLFAGVKPLINKKAGLITHIGQNTWPVFLLHGFVVRLAPIYMSSLLATPWGVLLLTAGILVLFGNKICSRAVYYLGLSVLEKLPSKAKT